MEVNDVTKIFRMGSIFSGKKRCAVDHVSFRLPGDRPSILSIVGESGCGKSTLCKMILGIHRPDGGTLKLCGKEYYGRHGLDVKEFRRMVQPIFQNPYETFSVRKPVDSYLFNTALRLEICGSHDKAEALVDEMLKAVGLSLDGIHGKYPAQFSGGELQRISIARALIVRPKLIVADEPVAAIDASMKMNIVNLFQELKEKFGVSFLYITHDLSTAYYVSDEIVTLYRGRMVESGPATLLMDEPLHPYTEMLMNAVPKLGDKWSDSAVMPDIEEKEYGLTGCRFAPRCPYATDRCRQENPPELEPEPGRRVKCFAPLKHLPGV